ncbi:caspase-3-like isoform X2 [Dysidea avara]|uniref:caspase-3-like isoform X2 n=1 Tax=Dysidea avara TaxID=196820 RepID=UPI00331F1973
MSAVQHAKGVGCIVRLGMPPHERPQMRELNRFLTEYCGLWRPTGLQLGIKAAALDVIDADHRMQQRECFRVTLQKWLQQDVRACWHTLELAITNARREELDLDALQAMPPPDKQCQPVTRMHGTTNGVVNSHSRTVSTEQCRLANSVITQSNGATAGTKHIKGDDMESDNCPHNSKKMNYPVISPKAPICAVVMNSLRLPSVDVQQATSMDVKLLQILGDHGLKLHPCPSGCTAEEMPAFLTVLASSRDIQDNLRLATKCNNMDKALKMLSQNEKMKTTLEVLTSEECVKVLNITLNNDTIRDSVVKILEKPLSEYSGLMVFVTSQGGDGGKLFGSDGNAVTIEQLSTLFSARNCQDLVDKPKIFIIQAFRGEQDATRESRGANVGSYDSKPSFGCVPDEADFLYVYSTPENTDLYKDGSPFIQTFVEVLNGQLNDKHLEGALLNFRREITCRNCSKQCGVAKMPSVITNLTYEI